MNNKLGLVLLSLVAAVPGGYLCFLLVMAMLSSFGKMSGMMRGMVCLILVFGAVVTATPLGIMIFGPKDESETAGKGRKGKSDDEPDSDDLEEVDEADDLSRPAAATGGQTSESVVMESVEMESVEVESEEMVDDDLYMTDDEPEPVKKKKKGKK